LLALQPPLRSLPQTQHCRLRFRTLASLLAAGLSHELACWQAEEGICATDIAAHEAQEQSIPTHALSHSHTIRHKGLAPIASGEVALSTLIERRLEARLYSKLRHKYAGRDASALHASVKPAHTGSQIAASVPNQRMESMEAPPSLRQSTEAPPSLRVEMRLLDSSPITKGDGGMYSIKQSSTGGQAGQAGAEANIVVEVSCTVQRVLLPNSRWLKVLNLLQDKANSRSLSPDLNC